MDGVFPVLGFDVGGTKIAVCLGDSNGKIIASGRVPNQNRPPSEILPEIAALGDALLAEAGLKAVELGGVGIGAPGPIDIEAGLILSSPNMSEWKRVAIRDFLAGHFGVAATFDNDANAGALAEWIFGSGQGCRDMIYLTMSTGIGGGVIANGHLLHGKSGLAGEVGHMVIDINGPQCNCGLTGCYEAFCGGRAIAQRVIRELANQPDHPVLKFAEDGLESFDMLALENAVRAGVDYAERVWSEMCLRNAQAVGVLLNTFNPEKIVLGTLAWAAGDLFMEPMLKQLPKYCWPETLRDCEIVPSALRRQIGEIAGISAALYGLYEKGEWQPAWM